MDEVAADNLAETSTIQQEEDNFVQDNENHTHENDPSECSRRYKNKRIPNVLVSNFIVKSKVQKPVVIIPTCNEELENNDVNEIFDIKVDELLKKVKKQQDKNWKKNENKARSSRHIVCGFHETLKHLLAGNIKAVFIAKNIDSDLIDGSSTRSSMFHRLRNICLYNDIPLISASTKKNMSRCVNKHPYIGCIGLMRNDGFEVVYNSIIKSWKESDRYICFHLDQISLFA